jgi:hypothetical protein
MEVGMSDLKQAHHVLAGTVAATATFAHDLLESARNVEGLPSEADAFIERAEYMLRAIVNVSEKARIDCEEWPSREKAAVV